MSDVTKADIGWATSAAQHLCAQADRDFAIGLLSDAFRQHRLQARADALEEAAKVADGLFREPGWNDQVRYAAEHIATAIRNLRSTEDGEKT